MGRIPGVQQLDKRIGEAKLGIGIFSLCGNAGTADEGIVGTKNQRHGIEQE
jgi:hypothetical protein